MIFWINERNLASAFALDAKARVCVSNCDVFIHADGSAAKKLFSGPQAKKAHML